MNPIFSGRDRVGFDNNMDDMDVYTWADERCYMGEYKDDKKHGYGIYKWADGRLYLGQWMRGK